MPGIESCGRTKPTRETVSAVAVAGSIWPSVARWPSKHCGWLQQNFADTLERGISEVLEEFAYFKSFALDLAFFSTLRDRPAVETAVRDAFLGHLREFALAQPCKP